MADNALIIVDVQNCFLPGGSLGIEDGDKIIPVLNRYIRLFNQHGLPIYATRDWHPKKTIHFKEYGGPWPEHCVRDTPGAEFSRDLELPETTKIMSKGVDPQSHGYSAFEAADENGVKLEESLKRNGVQNIYIGGLTTEYCVRNSAIDALRMGIKAIVLVDAIKGVEARPGDSDRALAEMVQAGARMASFDEVEEELESE